MTPRDLLRILGEELRRRPYLIGFLIVLAGLALWAVIPNPRRAIKHVIQRGERICEARDVERLKSIMAAEFQSDFGGDRESTIEHVRAAFEFAASIEIRIKQIETEVKGDQAQSTVTYQVVWTVAKGEYKGTPFYGLPDSPGLLQRCELRFVKEQDGYWRVSGVRLLGTAGE